MQLLEQLYAISSPSGEEEEMISFVIACLKKLKVRYTVDRLGNIYATKGISDTYPTIVAHLDQVQQRYSSNYEVINFRDEIYFGYDNLQKCYQGIGADDKNGIWVALKALEEFDIIKCAFFTQEESGGIGSAGANINFFNDSRFVLQCDRKGNSDFITSISGSKLASKDFIKEVNMKAYGYKEAWGLFTDVYNLKSRGVKASCVNISCGYYNPHCDEEYTKVEDLKKCYSFVKNIIVNCTDVYPHNFTEKYGSYGNYYGRYGNYRDELDDWYNEHVITSYQ